MTNKYEQQKKLVNKLNFNFQGDNLIALAKMVLVGNQILKDNKCEELLTKLTPNVSVEGYIKPKIDL